MNHLHDSHPFYRIFPSRWQFFWSRRDKPHPLPLDRPVFDALGRWPQDALPFSVRQSPLAQKYLTLLRPIEWSLFPERTTGRVWPGPQPFSPVPYLIALLIKLDQRHRSLAQLSEFLAAHPELVWLAGFPLVPDPDSIWGFDVAASVPSPSQFSRLLRHLPNERCNSSWMKRFGLFKMPSRMMFPLVMWLPLIPNTFWPGHAKIIPKLI